MTFFQSPPELGNQLTDRDFAASGRRSGAVQ